MQGIYTYIPEINHVPKEYNVPAILSLMFVVPISLAPLLALSYFYISTFWSMCAVPSMAVFCSSLTSRFPGMVLTYFLNDFEMVPVAPIITGIALVFTFHIRCISIVRSLYVWLVIGDGPVSLYLLVPQYGYLTTSTCFYWFWFMLTPVLFVQLSPCFLAYVEV
jgi:hypothetical protein